jgi:hypothetical protein
MDISYIDKCQYEIQKKKKFQCGIPAYTGPFQALLLTKQLTDCVRETIFGFSHNHYLFFECLLICFASSFQL